MFSFCPVRCWSRLPFLSRISSFSVYFENTRWDNFVKARQDLRYERIICYFEFEPHRIQVKKDMITRVAFEQHTIRIVYEQNISEFVRHIIMISKKEEVIHVDTIKSSFAALPKNLHVTWRPEIILYVFDFCSPKYWSNTVANFTLGSIIVRSHSVSCCFHFSNLKGWILQYNGFSWSRWMTHIHVIWSTHHYNGLYLFLERHWTIEYADDHFDATSSHAIKLRILMLLLVKNNYHTKGEI